MIWDGSWVHCTLLFSLEWAGRACNMYDNGQCPYVASQLRSSPLLLSRSRRLLCRHPQSRSLMSSSWEDSSWGFHRKATRRVASPGFRGQMLGENTDCTRCAGYWQVQTRFQGHGVHVPQVLWWTWQLQGPAHWDMPCIRVPRCYFRGGSPSWVIAHRRVWERTYLSLIQFLKRIHSTMAKWRTIVKRWMMAKRGIKVVTQLNKLITSLILYIMRIMIIVLLISPRNQINKRPHYAVRLEYLSPQAIVSSPESTNNGRMPEDIKGKIGPLANHFLRRRLLLMDHILRRCLLLMNSLLI